LAAASISAGINAGQPAEAVSVMKAMAGGVGGLQLTPSSPLRQRRVAQSLTGLGTGTNPLHINPASQNDWDLHPDLYVFPPGFPRTDQEKQLVTDTTKLIDSLKSKTDQIAQTLADNVNSRAASWALPSFEGIDWTNKEERFGVLSQCDQRIQVADSESHKLFADILISMTEAAVPFLEDARQRVYCHPQLFEDYWAGQLRHVTTSGGGFMDDTLTQQRAIIDNLKTKLSELDFTQQESEALTAQAQQQQNEGVCNKVADVVREVGIVVTFSGAIIAVIIGIIIAV
jgi:hypothetical protein